jgi:Helix-turn-helix domain
MARGRRPTGVRLIEKLDGPSEAKQRLELILETLAGQRSIVEASHALGISERRFYELRWQFLEEALDWLQPRPAGRRGAEEAPPNERIARLEGEVQQLQFDLRAAQVREEIALALPHLAHRSQAAKKSRRRTTSNHAHRTTKPDA